MTKRRRERDRPKAGPEAPYNPNKRVLLSYDSDEEPGEVVEPAANTGHSATVDAATADYQIEEYPDDEGDGLLTELGEKLQAKAMENDELSEEDVVPRMVQFQPKRKDPKNHLGPNKATGQFPALGSLSFQNDEESVDEEGDQSEEDEAMAYLRTVRSERQAMPTFFKSSKEDLDEQLYDTGVGDSRGYYDEDTYIGAPDPVSVTCAAPSISPQEVYTAALKKRFLDQRVLLHQLPSEGAIAALSRQHPIVYMPNSMKQYTQWTRLLNTIAPLPAQVRQMSQETCFNLLHLLSLMYLTREHEIRPVTSAWVWSLLARLDDVGTMNNDQVYLLRELGKKAVLVQLSFTDPEAARQLEAMSAADENAAAGNKKPADDAKQSGVSANEGEGAATGQHGEITVERENTRATLDMMLAIIGEVFGQRDLLEFRRQWRVAATEADAENG